MRVQGKRIIAAAAVLGAVTALLPAGAAAAAPAPCTGKVTLAVWGGPWSPTTGLIANVEVTNNTIAGITDFRFAFQTPTVTRVSATWGQEIAYSSSSWTKWSVRPHKAYPKQTPPIPAEDPNLPPGRTIKFGLQAELGGQLVDSPPATFFSALTTNGKHCEVVFV